MKKLKKYTMSILILMLMVISIAIIGCSKKDSSEITSVTENMDEDSVIATFNITIPEPISDDLLITAGTNMNNWNPADSSWIAEKVDDTHYKLTMDLSSYVNSLSLDENGKANMNMEYKWTLQKKDGEQDDIWSMVEVTSDGQDINNRIVSITNGKNEFNDVVECFKKEGQVVNKESTVVGKLDIVELDMPQLESKRNIRIWLPEGYDANDKKTTYPVLYMHDGQNVFDNKTSFAGEWKADETITELMKNGYEGSIVVGIDNSDNRMQELYPSFDSSVGTGEKYAEFIVKTVKPYIDSHYNTKPDKKYTGIGGSSMGGVMSLYMGLKYPDIFGYELCFSPALVYWPDELVKSYMKSTDFTDPPKIFIYCGGVGINSGVGNDEASLTKYVDIIKNDLIDCNYPADRINTLVDKSKTHNEAAWSEYFVPAYKWCVGIE